MKEITIVVPAGCTITGINKDGYINNNYPPPFEFNIHCETLNDYYTVNKCKVFTCGYTKYERHKKD